MTNLYKILVNVDAFNSAFNTKDQEILSEMIESAIREGADINEKDRYGQTVLHHAIFQQAPIIIELLLHKKANVNAQDNNGQTPLLEAISSIKEDKILTHIMTMLIEQGADRHIANKKGQTPLNTAAFFNHFTQVDQLMKLEQKSNNRVNDREIKTSLQMMLRRIPSDNQRNHSIFLKIIERLIQDNPDISSMKKDKNNIQTLLKEQVNIIPEILMGKLLILSESEARLRMFSDYTVEQHTPVISSSLYSQITPALLTLCFPNKEQQDAVLAYFTSYCSKSGISDNYFKNNQIYAHSSLRN